MDSEPIRKVESKPITSFKTEMGSIYTYDRHGQTSRFKVATGEKYPVQDITAFVNVDNSEGQRIKIACDRGDKVYIAEKETDDNIKIVRNLGDIKNKNELYLIIAENGAAIFGKKVSLEPTIGYQVFDTRHFQEKGQWKTESHLGNKVTEINY